MPAGKLDEGIAVLGRPLREAHADDEFVRFDRRGHIGDRKLGERHLALASGTGDRDGCVIAGRERDQFRRRIEMAQRAADGAAVAGLTVSDLQQGLVHDRPARAHRLGKFEVTLARHGPDVERALRVADVGEALDAIEIDDVIGQHEAHVEHRHQRLAAGKELGVFQAGEQPDRLADGFRIVIAKGRRLHRWRVGPGGGTSLHTLSTVPQSKKSFEYGRAVIVLPVFAMHRNRGGER